MKLSKPLIAVLIAVVAVLIVVAWIIIAYNGMIASEQSVEAQWADVENQYQRKIDLIPNLIDVTSQYTQFEKSVLENITNLRTQWLSDLTVEERVNTSNALDGQLILLVATYESYPTLSSIPLVAGLMDELAGTENRIAVERLKYNDEVRNYNTKVKKFPNSIIAGMFDFDERQYFDPIPGGP